MTRKEAEKELLESLGLSVGDRIKVTQENYVHANKIFVIRETEDDRDYDGYYLGLETSSFEREMYLLSIPETPSLKKGMYSLSILIDTDWEKVETPLKDKKCEDFNNCEGCPLHDWFCAELIDEDPSNKIISEIYNKIEKKLFKAKEEIFGEEE